MRKPVSPRSLWPLAVPLLIAGVLAALTLEGLHQRSAAGRSPMQARGVLQAASPTWTPPPPPMEAPAFAREAEEPPPAPVIPPWEATPENSPIDADLPPGFEPAWVVRPPRPIDLPEVPVVEPPDPASTRLPEINPLGVNGDRGERPAAP